MSETEIQDYKAAFRKGAVYASIECALMIQEHLKNFPAPNEAFWFCLTHKRMVGVNKGACLSGISTHPHDECCIVNIATVNPADMVDMVGGTPYLATKK